MTTLFPDSEGRADSPRLKWIKANGAIIKRFREPCNDVCATLREFGEQWTDASNDDAIYWAEYSNNRFRRIGQGTTEDEALADLASKIGLRLWNEDGM